MERQVKFRLVSDLHTEGNGFKRFAWEKRADDKDTVLLLAGDIGTGRNQTQLQEWLSRQCEQFYQVIMTAGNHDYYHGNMSDVDQYLASIQCVLPNFTYLQGDSVLFGDVRVIGATAWTNFNDNNPLDKIIAYNSMSDYRCIISPLGHPILPSDIFDIHQFQMDNIFWESDDYGTHGNEKGVFHRRKKIIMTHHPLTLQSIHEQYKGNPLNHAFVSDYDEHFQHAGVNVFVHGHVHNSFDYFNEVTQSRVICNPHGYAKENPSFDLYKDFTV